MLLACVHIEHELAERALEPRQTLLQDNKARAGEFRRKLEIHLSERFAQIEMLLRLECVVAFFAEYMMLDVAARVGAVRHVIERRVGDLRKLLVERGGQSFLLVLHRRQRGLELGDFGHQLARLGLILRLFRVADFLRRRIAAGLRLLEFCDGCPPLFVQRHELFRQRIEPAPFQAAVEDVRMLANPLDVVHCNSCLPKRDARHKAGHDNVNNSGKPYSAGFALAEAASEAAFAAASARAFFSTRRTDQIEPS